MTQTAQERCTSCQGAGEIGTDNGPVACPDCFGEGRQLDSMERIEWRLRDIERAHAQGTPHGCDGDMRWMVFELRRAREAMVQILSRCQDCEGAGEDTARLASAVAFVANRALNLYAVRPE